MIHTFKPSNICQVLVHTKLRPHNIILVHNPNIAPCKHITCTRTVKALSQQVDLAAAPVHRHSHHLEYGALTRPARAKDAHDFILEDAKGDILYLAL